jgi:outer membrane lipoprotein-sorting protein
MKMKIARIVLMTSLVLNTTVAQKASEVLTANNILEKVVQEFDGVQDFTATINAEVKMERVQIPKMSATMYFKKPDKIHFSSQSFLLVPRDGIVFNPAVLRELYDASFLGEDSVNGRNLYKLQLAAKEKKTRLRQLYIWVDPASWTITRTETIPYEGRTLSMVFKYERQQEKYWLPSQLIVSFGSITEGERASGDSAPEPSEQFHQMQRGMPRNGSVTILYSNYKVNAGIDDAVFEEKK